MAQQMTSGKVLRETRDRKGYDLTTVARRLRIRPDILRAIEAGDFSSMPPRGYARNMVNAYARLLGLNPTEIVNMYLDEAYAYQVKRARDAAPGSGFVMESDYRRPRLRARGVRDALDDSYSAAAYDEADANGGSATGGRTKTRHLYDDRTPYSRDDYGVTRDRVERPGRSDKDFLSHHSGYGAQGYGSVSNRGSSGRRGRSRDIHVGQTPMQYSAPRFPAVFQSRWVLIAAIALVVLVIIAVVVFVTGRNAQPAQDDVSQLPVSGISDTTGTDETKESQAAQVEVAPTSARVVYTVEKGDDCYIETYTDGGAAVGEMLSGPAQNSIEVTGTWTITTWSPDTVKVTVNSEDVELKANSEYGGMYAYTVDFPSILEEWKKTHNSKSSQREAAVASASNAASKASSSSSSEEEEEAAAGTVASETQGSAQ